MESSINKINLGCGKDTRDGYLNVDIVNMPGVDLVHDLSIMPWPIEAQADEIIANDVIEHLPPIRSRIYIEFMEECHRLLKPGGVLYLRTCYGTNRDFVRDLSHFKAFNEESFDYFVPDTFWEENYGHYSPIRFKKESFNIENDSIISFKFIKL